jgi:glycosyltransferase involved in cell wall biosynthesis
MGEGAHMNWNETNARKISILFYFGGFAPVGGIETFCAELLESLTVRGLETRLLCWGPRSELQTQMRDAGVAVQRIPFRWGCRWQLPDRLLAKRAEPFIRDADVVIFGKLFCRDVMREIDSARRTPGHPPFMYVTPYRPSEQWGEKGPEPEVIKPLDIVVVQAKNFQTEIRRYGYSGPIEQIPYIPPEPPQQLSSPPDGTKYRIGFLGRLAEQKNLTYLLKSFSRVLNHSCDVEMHFFGDGPERPRLEELGEKLGISETLVFHGWISRENVGSAIDSCHMFAFSSVSEGQCLAALEVLSRGRPLVATPVGALPDILQDPALGQIAPLGDEQAYADKLSLAIERCRQNYYSPTKVVHVFQKRF